MNEKERTDIIELTKKLSSLDEKNLSLIEFGANLLKARQTMEEAKQEKVEK